MHHAKAIHRCQAEDACKAIRDAYTTQIVCLCIPLASIKKACFAAPHTFRIEAFHPRMERDPKG
jgi:hypothetical protein